MLPQLQYNSQWNPCSPFLCTSIVWLILDVRHLLSYFSSHKLLRYINYQAFLINFLSHVPWAEGTETRINIMFLFYVVFLCFRTFLENSQDNKTNNQKKFIFKCQTSILLSIKQIRNKKKVSQTLPNEHINYQYSQGTLNTHQRIAFVKLRKTFSQLISTPITLTLLFYLHCPQQFTLTPQNIERIPLPSITLNITT